MVRILNERHQDLGASKSNLHHYIQQMKKPNQFQKALADNAFDLPYVIKHGWLKTKEASIFIKNNAEVVSFDEMREDLIEELKEYSPSFKKIARKPITDPHCLVIDPADLHIGKLADPFDTGDTYNHEIAIQRATEGIAGILDKAAGFKFDQIVFIVGSDVLHVDSKNNATTAGTPQDVSQKWYRNYLQARDLYIAIIEMLLPIADVHIQYNSSNHDYVSGFMLVDSIYCWFRKCKNMTFNIDMLPRKYFKYGNSLIGTSHGDNRNMDQLPLAMGLEAKELWSQCKYYYWYLEHIHHKQFYKFMMGKDMQGVSIEFLRSASGTDSWHKHNLYANNLKAIEAFIHSKEHGQIARLTHLF